MPKYKQVNNELIEITGSELAQLEAKEQAWIDGALDRELEALRQQERFRLGRQDQKIVNERKLSTLQQRIKEVNERHLKHNSVKHCYTPNNFR